MRFGFALAVRSLLLCAGTATAQDQAPTRTTAAPRIKAVETPATPPTASPQSAAATEGCVATSDAPDRSRLCDQLSKGNPAIVDQNPLPAAKRPARRAPRR